MGKIRSPKISQSVKVLKRKALSRTLHVGQWKRVTESQVHELGQPQLCWGVSGPGWGQSGRPMRSPGEPSMAKRGCSWWVFEEDFWGEVGFGCPRY